MKGLHIVSFSLLAIGGVNWFLVGAAGWDVGELFGGQGATVSRLIYVLVGVAALVEVATHKKNCKMCAPMSSPIM